MRNDRLQEFIKLRRELIEEKSATERRLQQINEALGELQGSSAAASAPSAAGPKAGGKRTMSPEARERIAAAQRRRWAAQKSKEGTAEAAGGDVGGAVKKPKGKRKMSPEGRKAISEAAKRRWAAAHAAGQNRL